MIIYRIACVVASLHFGFTLFGANIKGTIDIDSTWESNVYLSEIASFGDLNTASYHFLRVQAPLDKNGYFEMNDLDLVEEDRIYRLHVCKKGDPISTIILGGREENFIHFAMNSASDLMVQSTSDQQGLWSYDIVGHKDGEVIKKIFALEKELHAPLNLPSDQNRNFVKDKVYEELKTIALGEENSMIKLLATYIISEQFVGDSHIDLYHTVKADLERQRYNGIYLKGFEEQLNFLTYKSGNIAESGLSFKKWFFGSLVVLLLFLGVFVRWKRVKTHADKSKKLQELSVQEKRIYTLLKEGKTNKEIALDLHIEVSTVKSHLHKIYSRLGVNSRKEIVNNNF